MDSHTAHIRPEVLFDFSKWWRCQVKILVVTDSASGGFDSITGFHLGQVLQVLATDPWPHVTFHVTKAHRGSSPTADLNGFRFDAHDLTAYSQIWLFGIERSDAPLSQGELRALAQFMDQHQGGVFATGDHEDLGRAMCGDVPRVRSMRRWWYPNQGPDGQPVAPEQSGSGRHDTVMGLGAGGSQSDDEPQPIRPRFYQRHVFPGIVPRVHRFPHPLLCGPNGVIDYLPDHMHEGLCEAPSDLTKTFSFSGYTNAEYPAPNGLRESPEVIAWATSRNTSGSEFGVLAAYDGHRAGVGRVVVDATWHHWFNINLVGFVNATDPTNIARWEEIKAYFRNVAIWLARPSLQTCLRNGGWWLVSRYFDIVITYRDLKLVRDPLLYYWQLGIFARDAMGRLASQCQSTAWIIDLFERPPFRIEVWPPIFKPPRPDPPPFLDVLEMETIALGGAVHAMLDTFGRDADPADVLGERARELEVVARRGAAEATLAWARHGAESMAAAAKVIETSLKR